MSSLERLVAQLNGLKGSGAWQAIAKNAGVDYFTVARIARGDIPNPGILTVEKISDAVTKHLRDGKAHAARASRRDGPTAPREQKGR